MRERLLRQVQKPGRYTGGERNAVIKPDPVSARIALCFPEIYEIAESHLGLKILYSIVNARPEFAAERAYAPWPDLEKLLRKENAPLWSLETYRPLCAFDLVGFSLQFELSYPTALAMLELGRIPIHSGERGEDDPIVLGGGPGAFNPEPLVDFFDAFFLGEAEQGILDIMAVVAEGRKRKWPRSQRLAELAKIAGVYVPSVVGPGGARARVSRRVVVDLDKTASVTAPIVPNVTPIHDRVAIEIQRGCTRGCRFCQAGMIARPTRQRSVNEVVRLALEGQEQSGADEIGLLSLSAGDYAAMPCLLTSLLSHLDPDDARIGIPSLRTESLSPELATRLAEMGRPGFTLAPEAGSERLRKVINKTNADDDLLNAVRAAVEAGWRQLKLYFMLGLPTETDADLTAIAELTEKAARLARSVRHTAAITVSVSTFVPKPHTPFQWEQQLSFAETERKQVVLRERMRRARINFHYHDAKQSYVEGLIARGDRNVGGIIEQAFRLGCRFDAWSDQFSFDVWQKAIEEGLKAHGVTADTYLAERDEAALLPWDHIDAGVSKVFLRDDRHRAYHEATVPDCSLTGPCYLCAACDLGRSGHERSGYPETTKAVLVPVLAKDVEMAPTRVQAPPAFAATPTSATTLASTTTPAPAAAPVSGTIPRPLLRQTLRIRYAKRGPAVFLSHLETMEQWLRALKQSGLKVAHSQGNRHRPLVGFSPACPTGVASEAELIDVTFEGMPTVAVVCARLAGTLPPSLVVLEAAPINHRAESVFESLESVTYLVMPAAGTAPDQVEKALRALAEKESLPLEVERKGRVREVDLISVIERAKQTAQGLELRLAFHKEGSVKVREVLTALFGPELAANALITKTDVRLRSSR